MSTPNMRVYILEKICNQLKRLAPTTQNTFPIAQAIDQDLEGYIREIVREELNKQETK